MITITNENKAKLSRLVDELLTITYGKQYDKRYPKRLAEAYSDTALFTINGEKVLAEYIVLATKENEANTEIIYAIVVTPTDANLVRSVYDIVGEDMKERISEIVSVDEYYKDTKNDYMHFNV